MADDHRTDDTSTDDTSTDDTGTEDTAADDPGVDVEGERAEVRETDATADVEAPVETEHRHQPLHQLERREAAKLGTLVGGERAQPARPLRLGPQQLLAHREIATRRGAARQRRQPTHRASCACTRSNICG